MKNQVTNRKEVTRVEMSNGFKIRLVDYFKFDNLQIMKQGELAKIDGHKAALEIIIPSRYNHKDNIRKFEEDFRKLFIAVEDAKWFKADKSTEFERKGDNVLELYGVVSAKLIEEAIIGFSMIKTAFEQKFKK
jgi:hypothetical protein